MKWARNSADLGSLKVRTFCSAVYTSNFFTLQLTYRYALDLVIPRPWILGQERPHKVLAGSCLERPLIKDRLRFHLEAS